MIHPMSRLAIALAAATVLLAAGCSAGTITAPRYVLSYGIGDYGYTGPVDEDHPDPLLLKCPAVDAQSLSELLESRGYSPIDGTPRTDGGATKDTIRADIQGLSSVESDAIVVIFFSGHGTYIPEGVMEPYRGAYLVPYDAVEKSTGYVTYATADKLISPAELNSWISQAGTRNVILIINSCYSGGFVDPGTSIDVAPQNYGPYDGGTTPASGILSAIGSIGELVSMNARESGSPGPMVISACGTKESTYENYSLYYAGHGIFPFYVLEAASKGDANSDGFVTVTEAYKYAVHRIKVDWNILASLYYPPEADPNQDNILVYLDFMPHISGGARDLVLFSN
jgi:hypothetical protein